MNARQDLIAGLEAVRDHLLEIVQDTESPVSDALVMGAGYTVGWIDMEAIPSLRAVPEESMTALNAITDQFLAERREASHRG